MRLLVCGSRHLPIAAQDWLTEWMKKVVHMEMGRGRSSLIHGGAQGTDAIADYIARFLFGWTVQIYPADWDQYDRSAGPRRNQQMIEEGKPDVILAVLQNGFPCRGTRDMMKRAMTAGLPLVVVTWK